MCASVHMYVYVWVFLPVGMFVHCLWVGCPWGPDEVVGVSKTKVADSHELTCGCWDSDSDIL